MLVIANGIALGHPGADEQAQPGIFPRPDSCRTLKRVDVILENFKALDKGNIYRLRRHVGRFCDPPQYAAACSAASFAARNARPSRLLG